MTEKLKPCPFCGGKAEACQTYDGFFGKLCAVAAETAH